MRSRKAHCSSPTPPAPAGSLDNPPFYELTAEGRRLLEQLHESATGTAAHRRVVRAPRSPRRWSGRRGWRGGRPARGRRGPPAGGR